MTVSDAPPPGRLALVGPIWRIGSLGVAFLLAAATLATAWGATRIPQLDNLTSFPQLFLLAAVVSAPGVWRFLRRGPPRWRVVGGGAAAALLLVLGWHGSVLAPWWIPPARVTGEALAAPAPPAAPAPAATRLRVLTFNLLARNRDAAAVRDFVATLDPDLIALQEAKPFWLEETRGWRDRLPHRLETKGGTGQLLALSKYPMVEAQEIYPAGEKRVALLFTLLLPDRRVRVVCTHPFPPTRSHDRWARRNRQLAALGALPSDNLILLGDLNVAMPSPFYKRLIAATGLRNARAGHGYLPTWPDPWAPTVGAPIDHILHDPSWRSAHCAVGPSLGSDHRPLWADLVATPAPPTTPAASISSADHPSAP